MHDFVESKARLVDGKEGQKGLYLVQIWDAYTVRVNNQNKQNHLRPAPACFCGR